MSDDIAVTVIGGYLGAGKTTLVNHLLRATGAGTVVLVNDFGSVNIDDDLIVATDDTKITLENGCICCSLADGLAVALDQVRALDPQPVRLVIEASGVSDPSAIASFARGGRMRIDAIVTVIDAETVIAKARDRYVGDVVTRQIAVADLLVLNKVDLVPANRCEATRALLRHAAPGVPIVESTHCAVLPWVLLDSQLHSAVASPSSGVPLVNANEMFVSWSVESTELFTASAIEAALHALPDWVVRAKGVMRSTTDHRLVAHRVGRRVEVSEAGPWRGGTSRVVAIGIRAEATPDSPLVGFVDGLSH